MFFLFESEIYLVFQRYHSYHFVQDLTLLLGTKEKIRIQNNYFCRILFFQKLCISQKAKDCLSRIC